MRREVLLVFWNSLQHGARLLNFFIEFGQEKFIDGHVYPQAWFLQSMVSAIV
jgi:hypothetical protein